MKSQDFVFDLRRLSEGKHKRQFQLDGLFFDSFEESPIGNAEMKAEIELDKRFDVLRLSVEIKGYFDTNCDRCMAAIHMPVAHVETWLFKQLLGENDANDPEIEILESGQTELDVRQYIYESAVLAIPMIKVYDCADDVPAPCDVKVLERLEGKEQNEESGPSGIWDQLKDIDF